MERMTDQGATLKRALALTCVILAVEFAGGVVSHSLALLSDAGHVLTDVFALGLAWFAIEQAKRPADRRRSYGYQRVSILAAFVNSVTLVVIVIAIAIEAVRRFANPEPVQGVVVIASALVAIVINAYVVFGLRGHGKNLNIRAALLHVTGDIGASAGVLEECPLGDAEHVVRDLETRLCSRFDIGHSTIQVESCHPCGEIHHGAGEHNHPHEHVLMTSSSPSGGRAMPPHAAGSAWRGR